MIKLSDFKKWRTKKSSETSGTEVICKNCKTPFVGHYCPHCGQSDREFDKPFSFFIYNFAGDFFSFDTRFFKTFVQLAFSPGKLTNEFFAGRRVRYAPPFRIFIFLSFVLFLLLQVLTTRQLTTALNSSSRPVSDSVRTEINAKIKSDSIALSLNLDSALATSGNWRQQLNKIASEMETELEDDKEAPDKIDRNIIRVLRSPEEALAEILKLLSWACFFLLPVFALILKLVYIRRKQNYIRHLVYSIHFHSFIFFDLIILVLLKMIFGSLPGWLVAVFFLLIPVYFLVSLKKVYGQSWGKALVKFFVVSALYNSILFFTIVFVFVLMVA